jgi:N-acetylglutamate synthase-like GNAT family acetyltransferase
MTGIIRNAKASDLEAVNNILRTNGQIDDITLDDVKGLIVAEVDGKVVGSGLLREHSDSFEVCKISVLPADQKKGIGMQIVMTLLGRAKGKRCWLLSVDSHDFWELFDFRIIPEIDEPGRVREQCSSCGKKPSCNRVVMCRDVG